MPSTAAKPSVTFARKRSAGSFNPIKLFNATTGPRSLPDVVRPAP
jgi:hypothetical protein